MGLGIVFKLSQEACGEEPLLSTRREGPFQQNRNPSSFRHSPKTVNLGTMDADKDKEKTTDEKKPAEQVTKKREHKSGSSSVFSPTLSVIV